MPDRSEIMNKVMYYKNSAQDIIRQEYLRDLCDSTKRDVIIYAADSDFDKPGITVDDISIVPKDVMAFMNCLSDHEGENLDLIIHSGGGSAEATEQIVQYLRSKYSHVRAIIPQFAMSAATMLACACDEIVMSKAAAIGPIDPQMTIRSANGAVRNIPAHSIIADIERAKTDVGANQKTAAVWSPILMEMPVGFIDLCHETMDLSKSMVEKWLNEYMFKNDKDKKGKEIAHWLGVYNKLCSFVRKAILDT